MVVKTFFQVVAEKQVVLDEESWMTVQVLAAVHPINTLTDDHQQEILKVWFIFSTFKQYCNTKWVVNTYFILVYVLIASKCWVTLF